MNDLYILAEKFAAKISQSSSPVVKTAGGRKHRKQLEKDLAYIKDVYNKRRASLAANEKSHADLSSAIDKERKEVAKHREEIMRCYDVLQNMDLYDIQEVRFMNDDIGYVKGKRLFRLDENQALVPFKRRKTIEDELETDVEENASNEEDDLTADDFLASLVE